MPDRHGFSLVFYQCSPFSRGEIRLRSSRPADPPRIAPHHLSDPRDLGVLLDATERMMDITEQPPLAKVIATAARRESRDVLAANIRATANNVYHTVGTCRIGSDPLSVVDPQLNVQGITGLRVADCSVIPRPIGSGTYALALMIGEKAADLITNSTPAPGALAPDRK